MIPHFDPRILFPLSAGEDEELARSGRGSRPRTAILAGRWFLLVSMTLPSPLSLYTSSLCWVGIPGLHRQSSSSRGVPPFCFLPTISLSFSKKAKFSTELETEPKQFPYDPFIVESSPPELFPLEGFSPLSVLQTPPPPPKTQKAVKELGLFLLK